MFVRLAGVCLLGGLLCTLLDQVHVHTGTLSYPHPDVFGQAWWVWPQFIVATLLTALGYPIVARLVGDPLDIVPIVDRRRKNECVASLVWFTVVYASSGFANAFPRLLAVVFVGAFIVRALAEGSRALWLNALLLGMGGVATESFLSLHGMFHYDVPGMCAMLPVPIWLVGVYLHATFLVRAAFRCGLVANVYPSGARA